MQKTSTDSTMLSHIADQQRIISTRRDNKFINKYVRTHDTCILSCCL